MRDNRDNNVHFRDLADWSGTTPAQLLEAHLTRPANTRRSYAQDIEVLVNWMKSDDAPTAIEELIGGGRGACKRRLISWINWMRSKNLSASTIRRRVAAVSSMVSMALDLEIIGWQVGRLPLPSASRVRDCSGPSRPEVERMFIACRSRNDPKGRRDEAALGLLYWEALRASEVLSIQMSDIDLETRTVRIVAKRGQGRMTLHICRQAAEAIERWIEFRGEEDGPLFSRCVRYGRKVLSLSLSYWGLRGVIRELGAEVGVRCWPHALRHAAISHLAGITGDSPLWGLALS